MRIIFATHNNHKMREIRQILGEISSEVLSLDELRVAYSPIEDGRSFSENSEKKAVSIRDYLKKKKLLREGDVVLADDSGLCIDYLDGAPGIHSSRYLGEDTAYEIKNRKIIELLEGVKAPERGAHFTCNICASFADGRLFHTEALFPGIIAYEPRGENGFGYDPILYLPNYRKTSAELDPEEKNRISHRGKALREMRRLLLEIEESDWKILRRNKPLNENAGFKPRRILIVSDSHRKDELLLSIIEREKPFNMLIHLGDVEGSEDRIRMQAGEGVDCYFVQGNNDFFSDLPKDQELLLGMHRCLLTHGHSYGVSMDINFLVEEARSRGCDIAMFGHTHRPCLKTVNGVECVNPGSISYPRQQDRRCTYMVAEMDSGGKIEFEQRFASQPYKKR